MATVRNYARYDAHQTMQQFHVTLQAMQQPKSAVSKSAVSKRAIKGYSHSLRNNRFLWILSTMFTYLLIQNHMRHERSYTAREQGIVLHRSDQ